MMRSRSAVRAAVGCTLLAPALLAVNQVVAAPSAAPASLPASAPALHIGVSAVGNTITFKPGAGVRAVRVQITSATGNQLYNSGWVSGFDVGLDAVTWQALDDQGALLPAGVYLTQVDMRSTTGITTTESGSLQLDTAPITTKDVMPRATITGGGTANRIVLWTSSTTVGDSIITQTNGTTLSVAGTINATAVNATNNGGNALVGNSKSGTALAGITQTGNGVLGTSTSAYGMRGVTGTGIGVRGDSNNGTIGVQGNSNAAASNGRVPIGVDGNANGSSGGIGTRGTSTKGYGVQGVSTSGIGVRGDSTDSTGVHGSGKDIGVFGESGPGTGVVAYSASGTGVSADSYQGTAIKAFTTFGTAGDFSGNVIVRGNLQVTGTLSKMAGSFRIDDPLDPAHKYLSHSFVESPDMMNLYNGTVTLDTKGQATVTMPAYFSALNRDFRYQLTCIGGWSPVYVARKISGNTWQIAGGKPGLEVSWQVTGVRRDPWANDHRIPTQQLKTGAERGRYLYPAGYHKPESLGIDHLVAKPPLPKLGVQQAATQPAVKHSAPPRVAQVKG